MSLINKVLTDLEARNREQEGGAPQRVVQGLQPSPAMVRKTSRWALLGATSFIGAVAVGVGVYVWLGTQQAVVAPAAVTPVVKVPATSSPPPAVLASAAPAQAQVSPPTPVADAAPAQAPAATPVDKVASAAPAPEASAPEAAPIQAPLAEAAVVVQDAVAPPRVGTLSQHAANASSVQTAKPKAPAVATKPRPVDAQSPLAEPSGAIEKKERPLSETDRAENAYRAAVEDLKRHRQQEAERALKTALEHDVRHVKARELLASVYLEQGRWADATTTLEEGLRHLPQEVSFAQLLARMYVEQGKDQQALTVLERARPVAKDPEFVAFLAALYQRLERHPDAINAYGSALKERPQEARWWLGLGISLEAEKRLPEAREAYRRAAHAGTLNAGLARYVAERLAYLDTKLP